MLDIRCSYGLESKAKTYRHVSWAKPKETEPSCVCLVGVRRRSAPRLSIQI